MEALEGGWTSLAWQCAGLCSTTLGYSYHHYGALTSRARVKMRTGIMLTGVTAAGDNHPLARMETGDSSHQEIRRWRPAPAQSHAAAAHYHSHAQGYLSIAVQIGDEANISRILQYF